MERWLPRSTVACVVERGGRYLMVEERDKTSGVMVFNQPAGHLEQGESLPAAALRETLEETGWEVALHGLLSIALYTSPHNGLTYHRTTFVATPLRLREEATLDPDIHQVHWMSYSDILAVSAKLRSPLVLATIERHRQGRCYSLDLIENT